jgi:hypothetical protein
VGIGVCAYLLSISGWFGVWRKWSPRVQVHLRRGDLERAVLAFNSEQEILGIPNQVVAAAIRPVTEAVENIASTRWTAANMIWRDRPPPCTSTAIGSRIVSPLFRGLFTRGPDAPNLHSVSRERDESLFTRFAGQPGVKMFRLAALDLFEEVFYPVTTPVDLWGEWHSRRAVTASGNAGFNSFSGRCLPEGRAS